MSSSFEPSCDEQRKIIHTDAPLTVVLGGAGTGKTTCASAASRRYLEHRARTDGDRTLFLSFSRASVSRIADRSQNILGPYKSRVDITTFHALAWSIVNRFGSIIGLPTPTLASPAYHRLNPSADALEYDDLIPSSLRILQASPLVKAHLQSRWGLVIADEYQDTDDAQNELLMEVSAHARTILLGDANQCIYTFRRSDGVRTERLNEACAEAGTDNTIMLPDVSHRDPSGLIPAIATAIMRRTFDSPVLAQAIDDGRLMVRANVAARDETSTVADVVRNLQDQNLGVAVFSHHNDMLAALSDGLRNHGIDHEVAGLDDAAAAALRAQVEMLRYAAGDVDWTNVTAALAVFAASAVRGRSIPTLAGDLQNGGDATTLQESLLELQRNLEGATTADSLTTAATAHTTLGLPTKRSAWTHASALLRPMTARATRQLRKRATPSAVAAQVVRDAQDVVHELLTHVMEDPAEVQLMNLYQTKGREADATVVVLRNDDFFGREDEPFPDTSRLLYVVFSRARHRIIVILVGNALPPAVAPLAHLTGRRGS